MTVKTLNVMDIRGTVHFFSDCRYEIGGSRTLYVYEDKNGSKRTFAFPLEHVGWFEASDSEGPNKRESRRSKSDR